ncbi:hypothetical protein K438DRAFT_1776529 [Mycena galopus ATCC 62051]|nr:hypothetical protein K438DRAFT_1776529 [Mycena galopus ATCC 62051]
MTKGDRNVVVRDQRGDRNTQKHCFLTSAGSNPEITEISHQWRGEIEKAQKGCRETWQRIEVGFFCFLFVIATLRVGGALGARIQQRQAGWWKNRIAVYSTSIPFLMFPALHIRRPRRAGCAPPFGAAISSAIKYITTRGRSSGSEEIALRMVVEDSGVQQSGMAKECAHRSVLCTDFSDSSASKLNSNTIMQYADEVELRQGQDAHVTRGRCSGSQDPALSEVVIAV